MRRIRTIKFLGPKKADITSYCGYNQEGFQQKPQFNNFQGSYQAPPSANSASSSGDNEMKMMMQQILEGQKKNVADINMKVDGMKNDLHGKFKTLASHVKTLENQVAQTVSAST